MNAIRIITASILATVSLLMAAVYLHADLGVMAASGPVRFSGPISSQPLALSADDSLLIVANPDNNSVSIFDTRPGVHLKVAEIPVGKEPNGVAISPDGSRAYVANTVSGTVTVLAIDRTTVGYGTTVATIPVGTEPYGVALTPTGRKLYVTNARSNTVSVIDTATNRVSTTITNVGLEPRGIAITNNGGDDAQETVYVTQFLSAPVTGKVDGADDAKAGHVTIISAATDRVTGDITINPLADSGFKAAGDALQRIAPPATPVADDFKFVTGVYPNQLNALAIRGRYAFVPNTGASPNGPVRFDVNTQSLLSVIDLAGRKDAGKTINMHKAVSLQTGTPKRFITQPWSIAFKNQADEGYVISSASNIVVKVKIDPATGAPVVQNDPNDSTRVLQIPTGKNPRGIVVNSTDKFAYVMNYVSRDVTVIDLSGPAEKVSTTLASASLPTAGSQEDTLHVGKELYFTSIGEFDPPSAGKPAVTGRMSNNGWGSCSSCHPFGLSDNVVWIFPPGPRRTIPQHTDFDQTDPTRKTMKALNWSAERDEQEDFELNIRAVSGGQGLIVLDDGVTQDPNVANFTPLASANRNQLKVRGVKAWDAIRTFVQSGIRAPISPVSKTDPDVLAGRQLFIESNCQSCHGGAQWTSSRVRATPPPDASMLTAGQLIAELRTVGTFDGTAFNEVRQNAAAPLGAAGFNPPSLLSLFAFPQTFFHNGSVNSLEAVMQNVAHRTAGTKGVDRLSSPAQRAQVVKFLESIDAATVPINPATPGNINILSAASYIGNKVAPESDAVSFGDNLAVQAVAASSPQLSNSLGGTTVAVQDAAGVMRLAPLFYVGPGQVNYLIPAGTASGRATVTVTSNSGALSTSTIDVAPVAPGLFAANAGGTGTAAATAIRVLADGTQVPVSVFACDGSGQNCTGLPMDVGTGSESLIVTFYGTGLRLRSSLQNVKANIGGVDVPVLFAGPQGQFVGLDQINVQIPASLKGRGVVNAVFTIDGIATPPVSIRLQ